jgi:hypothetical protein
MSLQQTTRDTWEDEAQRFFATHPGREWYFRHFYPGEYHELRYSGGACQKLLEALERAGEEMDVCVLALSPGEYYRLPVAVRMNGEHHFQDVSPEGNLLDEFGWNLLAGIRVLTRAGKPF